MDLAIQTGSTKSGNGYALLSRAFDGSGGDRAVLLLQVRARRQSADALETLEQECAHIVKHALLETEGEAWTRLDGTLKEMNGLFKGLLVADGMEDVHAVVAVVEKSGLLHVAQAGRGEAWLLRGSVASQITEFTRGKPVPNFVHISSGELEHRDTVVLSTERLLRAVTPAQLGQMAGAEDILQDLARRMQAESEVASLAIITVDGGRAAAVVEKETEREEPRRSPPARRRRGRHRGGVISVVMERVQMVSAWIRDHLPRRSGKKRSARQLPRMRIPTEFFARVQAWFSHFLVDLRDPRRRKRAQLLLIAGALIAFLLIWLTVKLITDTQRSKTREQLSLLIDQITSELQTADNRRIAGDTDAANAILERAEEQAKQILVDQSQLYRREAADLLTRIHDKRDAINNIVKVPTLRVAGDVSQKNAAVSLIGITGFGDGDLLAFDKQHGYRINGTSVGDPLSISASELLAAGTNFPRIQSAVFLTAGSLLELADNQVSAAKTDDTNGWMTGIDVETYARFLYILSPATKQIYKYERLSNRYGRPANYNVSGDLTDALDMTIDASVYVLKKGGVVLKLLRGQAQPFVIRQAPAGLLADVIKLFKVSGGSFYFLDPVHRRVIVASDGGDSGESSYMRQYVIQDDAGGPFLDLYVDPDEAHAYLMDAKKVYVIDMKS